MHNMDVSTWFHEAKRLIWQLPIQTLLTLDHDVLLAKNMLISICIVFDKFVFYNLFDQSDTTKLLYDICNFTISLHA